MSFPDLRPIEADDAASVLAGLVVEQEAAARAEARKLAYAASWAAMHSTDSLVPGREHWHERLLPMGGEGCPQVREFCVGEFAAVLGMSTESGRRFLSEVVELYYRLRRCYALVQGGQLPAWRARRIAEATMCLSPDAAAWVDEQVAPVAHKVGPTTLGRLIEAAKATFATEDTELDRLDAATMRHAHVETDSVGPHGLVGVSALVDLPDALDLEEALRRGAEELKSLGSTEPLDVRRAQALGMLARGELTRENATGPSRVPKSSRRAVLHFHLSDAAAHRMARVEQTRSLITLEQLTEWFATSGARVTIKPVLDLAEVRHVEAYEVPERLREQVVLRDLTCAFAFCHRPAATADLDHIASYQDGGATSTTNLAPLCRGHHRLKTHAGWSYTMLEPGTFLWRSPHGHHFLKHAGTTTLIREPGPPPGSGAEHSCRST